MRWHKGADEELGKAQKKVAQERRNEGKAVWDQAKPKEKKEGGTRKGREKRKPTKRKQGDDSDDDLPLDQRAAKLQKKDKKKNGATEKDKKKNGATEVEPEVRPPQSPQVRPSPFPPPRICALPTGE